MMRDYCMIGLSIIGLVIAGNVVSSAISLFIFDGNARDLSERSILDEYATKSFYARHGLYNYPYQYKPLEAVKNFSENDNNTKEMIEEVIKPDQQDFEDIDNPLTKQTPQQEKRMKMAEPFREDRLKSSRVDTKGKTYLRKPANDSIYSKSRGVEIKEVHANDKRKQKEELIVDGENDLHANDGQEDSRSKKYKAGKRILMDDTIGVETDGRAVDTEEQPSTKQQKQSEKSVHGDTKISIQEDNNSPNEIALKGHAVITESAHTSSITKRKVLSVDDVPSCSHNITQYLECANVRAGHMVLMKWDSEGILDINAMNKTMSNADFQQWFQSAQKILTKGKPNSVALFLNTDMTGTLDWTIKPPIPLLSFTVPQEARKEDNIFVFPNPYDIGGYNRFSISNVKKSLLPFKDRVRKIIWRGCLHPGDSELSRLKVIELENDEKNHVWLDAAKTNKQKHKKLSMKEMSKYMYQLDLGGVSGTTWGALRWKLCTGNLVFKADTWSKDWWHDTIKPWKHYIPVKEDLSDLHEKFQWAEEHMDNARKIAEIGAQRCEVTNKKAAPHQYWENLLDHFPSVSNELVQEAERLLSEDGGPNVLTSKNLDGKKSTINE